jgi:hypothetical protein
VVADTGYCDGAEVKRCVAQQITPYVPKADTSANTAKGLYGKSTFRFEKAKDVYLCPAGQELTFKRQGVELGRTIRYYANRAACAACPVKARCTENKEGRRITREADEHLMEEMAARLAAEPEKYKLRKQLVEHPFGTLKRGWGFGYFLVKGLEKVRAEWSLMTLAYNMRRVLNLVSFETLMTAVKAMGQPLQATTLVA